MQYSVPAYTSQQLVSQPVPMVPVESAAVIPYQPANNYAVIPYQGASVVPIQTRPKAPKEKWLYDTERDPNAGEADGISVRKIMYRGTLWKPLMDEAYFCAHLSHQTNLSTVAIPGETLQFNSSNGRITMLTVVSISLDSNEISWRVLSDGRTNYVIFRGSHEWQYPIYESRLSTLHDVAPRTAIKVHTLLLNQLIPHMQDIIAALKSSVASRVVLAGHGNGGALATLCFLLLQRAGYARRQVVVYTFGAPLCTCGNLGLNRPLPHQISKSIFNFVNEDDIVPCLLGNKDLHTVDWLVSSDPLRENPFKNGRHNVMDIKSYRPIGRYFHFSKNKVMNDIPEGSESYFLNVNRGGSQLHSRLLHHSAEQYVSKLRKLVLDN